MPALAPVMMIVFAMINPPPGWLPADMLVSEQVK